MIHSHGIRHIKYDECFCSRSTNLYITYLCIVARFERDFSLSFDKSRGRRGWDSPLIPMKNTWLHPLRSPRGWWISRHQPLCLSPCRRISGYGYAWPLLSDANSERFGISSRALHLDPIFEPFVCECAKCTCANSPKKINLKWRVCQTRFLREIAANATNYGRCRTDARFLRLGNYLIKKKCYIHTYCMYVYSIIHSIHVCLHICYLFISKISTVALQNGACVKMNVKQ